MNVEEKKPPYPITREITVKKEIEKNRVKRALYAIGGSVALILAIVGIFLPGLPCTPFALLAAALFAKSSDKLYNRLLNNKILGPRIKSYQKRKGISKELKIQILLLMWAMVLISSLLIIKPLTLRVIVLSAGLVGTFVVWFIVPFGKDVDDENDSNP